MYSDLKVFQLANAVAIHAGHRQAVVARNLANADTPKFRARDIAPFQATFDGTATGLRQTRARHALDGTEAVSARSEVTRDAPMDPNGNSVSLELELMKSVEIKQQHDRALAVYRSSMSILRTSLGRG